MTVAGVPNIAGEGTWWMCGDTYLLPSCRDDQDQYKMPLIPGSKQESDLCSQLRNRLGHPTHHYNTITTPHSLTEYCCEAASCEAGHKEDYPSIKFAAHCFAVCWCCLQLEVATKLREGFTIFNKEKGALNNPDP